MSPLARRLLETAEGWRLWRETPGDEFWAEKYEARLRELAGDVLSGKFDDGGPGVDDRRGAVEEAAER